MTAPTWMDDALCQTVDSDLFFPAASDYAAARTAKWLCRRCPVIDSCLEYAVADPSIDGVWGGTSPGQRKTMRKEAGTAKRQRNDSAATDEKVTRLARTGLSDTEIALQIGMHEKTVTNSRRRSGTPSGYSVRYGKPA